MQEHPNKAQDRPTSADAQGSTRQTPQARSNSTFWLIIGVCLAPVVLSYFFYYGLRPEETTNYGDILETPVAFDRIELQPLVKAQRESALVDLLNALEPNDPRQRLANGRDFSGRWLMVYVGSGPCDAPCQDMLTLMRQVRLTTGRERTRVERLWLVPQTNTSELRPNPQLDASLEGTWVLGVTPSALAQWPKGGLYLVDPLGNLMMVFPDKPDAARVKRDLNRLLKASRIG